MLLLIKLTKIWNSGQRYENGSTTFTRGASTRSGAESVRFIDEGIDNVTTPTDQQNPAGGASTHVDNEPASISQRDSQNGNMCGHYR